MAQRKIEVFSAGCPACVEKVVEVKAAACPSCDVQVRDMKDVTVAQAAKKYGVTRIPAVVIDGKLADCCTGGGVELVALKRLGLGRA